MRIVFLTLFLGLASGRVPVELAVTPPPAGAPAITAIELLLDGTVIGGLTGPPFKGEVDLGRDLLPHRLVARGLDATGIEVARTEQWINLPQPSATVDLSPEADAEGRIAAVGLSFRSLTHKKPNRVTATLDGARLSVAHERVTLPAYNPERPHMLSIEARYPEGFSARRDLAFGGGLEGEVATDLTAVPVRAQGPLPTAPALAGWFAAGGQPLAASAVEEEGPAEILVVREPAALPALVTLARETGRSGLFTPARLRARSELQLDKGTVVRFVDSAPKPYSGEGATSLLFGLTREFDGVAGSLLSLLCEIGPEVGTGPSSPADAVAVAGLSALAANHRRAVVLLLAKATDASHHDAAAVRHYLESIRVPLYVWSLSPSPYPPVVAAWGEVEDVSNLYQLRLAYARLRRDLASQHIVWLEGRHLPQSITLTAAAAKGVELVSSPVH